MTSAAGVLLDGLAYGMALFVVCAGLSLAMGVMRVVNLAHGAFAMIGGYAAAALIQSAGLPYAAAVPLAIAGTVLLLLPLEPLLYRRLPAEPLPQILATVGLAFCAIGIASHVFGPIVQPIPLPRGLESPVDLGLRTLPGHKLLVIAAGATLALALWLVLTRTAFGARLRAVVENPDMAGALGIDTRAIRRASFALCLALAACGGILGAQLMPIEPHYALRYIVTFLVVVSAGGPGSITGTLVAALALGMVDTLARYSAPEYGAFFFYLAVIALVLARPQGLILRAGR
jgi:branched-chain amino acid transport system permease protein